MPFKKYQSLADVSTRNKRLSARPRGLRWTPRGLRTPHRKPRTAFLHARLPAVVIVVCWRRQHVVLPIRTIPAGRSWIRDVPLPGNARGPGSTSQNITLSLVACRAQGLEILVNGVSASTPGNGVVDLKGDSRRKRGAGSAGATRKVIPFHDPKAGTERWVPTGLVASGSVDQTWRNYVACVRVRYKLR